jgi:hypothetical protein
MIHTYRRDQDLQRLCDEREEESLTLEFKPCNELKIGTSFRDRTGRERDRQRDDVLTELTKDVTAFLNSAGGTLIYGILEKKGRADKVDKTNPFRSDTPQDNVSAEKVIDWLRDHIQPSPAVDVYPVFEGNDLASPWYLVIEVPQGQQAYMAKDHRFYKRIGATAKPMEQYEVIDAMNRTRGANLDLRIQMHPSQLSSNVWSELRLDISITSTNFVASEYGALKLTLAYPLRFKSTVSMIFPGSQLMQSTGLPLGGPDIPHAESLKVRWGAHQGNIVFPGDWYDFYGHGFHIHLPQLALIFNPCYLLRTELFTMNSQSREALFAIQQQPSSEAFMLLAVDASTRDDVIASFWTTYRRALESLKR